MQKHSCLPDWVVLYYMTATAAAAAAATAVSCHHRTPHRLVDIFNPSLLPQTMPPAGRSATTSMAKRGQILGYASLTGSRSMKLQEISEVTGIPLSTCAGIISNAKTRSKETGILDLCADVNLAPRPTCSKGMNKALTPAQEQALIELATKDRQHERMSYKDLAKEGGSLPWSFGNRI